MKVFTLGYQALKLDVYTQTLINAGIGIVLDVREVPWSYNRQYIKSILQRTLSDSGINYLHLKSCGNPSSNRKTATSIQECLDRYKIYLRQNPDCLNGLFNEIKTASDSGRPACLTCYEKSPHDCHRKILLDFLCETNPFLEVVHLQGELVPAVTKINPLPLFSDTISPQL